MLVANTTTHTLATYTFSLPTLSLHPPPPSHFLQSQFRAYSNVRWSWTERSKQRTCILRGLVPGEGDCSKMIDLSIDGQSINPELLDAGRREEVSYMKRHVFSDVVDKKESMPPSHVGEWGRPRLVCREIKRAKTKTNSSDSMMWPHHTNMLMSTMMSRVFLLLFDAE